MEQVTGVYTTNTTEAVRYQLKHSMANIAVVDGKAQLEKVILMMIMTTMMMIGWQTLLLSMEKIMARITLQSSSQVNDYEVAQSLPLQFFSSQVLAVRDKLPDLRAIVQYGEEEVEHDGVVSWEEFQVDNDDNDHTDLDNSNFTI